MVIYPNLWTRTYGVCVRACVRVYDVFDVIVLLSSGFWFKMLLLMQVNILGEYFSLRHLWLLLFSAPFLVSPVCEHFEAE